MDFALCQLFCPAGTGIDCPEMPPFPGQKACSIFFEKDARNMTRDHAQSLFIFVLFSFDLRLIFFTKLTDKLFPIGRPLKTSDASFEVGQWACFPAVNWDDVNLRLFFIPAIGKKGDFTPIG